MIVYKFKISLKTTTHFISILDILKKEFSETLTEYNYFTETFS